VNPPSNGRLLFVCVHRTEHMHRPQRERSVPRRSPLSLPKAVRHAGEGVRS
jgi:hypothetical protein